MEKMNINHELLQEQEHILRVLASPENLLILAILKKGDMAVKEVSYLVDGLCRASISKKLIALQSIGLISTRREDHCIINHFNEDGLDKIRAILEKDVITE